MPSPSKTPSSKILSAETISSKALGSETIKDARWQRSRAQLEAAVLELASERDITHSSVQELTRRAGINRSTFYSHATSPVDLLVQILSRELKQILDEGFERIQARGHHEVETSDHVVRAILAHVESHAEIYTKSAHRSSQYALRTVLTPMMEAGVLRLFDEHLVQLPTGYSGDIKTYAAFLTGGVVGAIESWIGGKKRRRKDQLLEIINLCYPQWFLHPHRSTARRKEQKS